MEGLRNAPQAFIGLLKGAEFRQAGGEGRLSMTAPGEAEDRALAGLLAGHRVLLCYGLLGEVIAGRGVGIDYMGAQADWLRRLGVAVEVVALPTAAPVGVNAARIAAAHRRTAAGGDRGHSKGGLEALAALLRPGGAARCRGFVALQSPFHGSPVADWLCGAAAAASRGASRAAGGRLGTGRGYKDLTTPVRRAWMRTMRRRSPRWSGRFRSPAWRPSWTALALAGPGLPPHRPLDAAPSAPATTTAWCRRLRPAPRRRPAPCCRAATGRWWHAAGGATRSACCAPGCSPCCGMPAIRRRLPPAPARHPRWR